MSARPRVCASIVAAMALFSPPGAGAQPAVQPESGTGVVVRTAPMYLFPDSSRTPLTTLAVGATVQIVIREGDWYRVEYRDPYLGIRTGYVLAASVQIQPGPRATPRAGAATPASPAAAAPPPAQPAAVPPTRNRGFVSLNGGYQQHSTGFTATTTFTQNAEQGTITTTYADAHPIVADIGVGYRAWRMLSAAVGLTWASTDADAAVTAGIPHPFSFNTLRPVSGTAPSLNRREIGVHLDAAFIVPQTAPVQIMVFGGPSIFNVRQDLVTAVTANEVYPYDTATFASATTVEASATDIGYNAGADVLVNVWNYAAVGAIVRYSRADVHLKPADGVDVKVRAGGLQVGAGIRFRF